MQGEPVLNVDSETSYLEWGRSALRGLKFSQRYFWTRKLQECHAMSFGISRRFEGSVPSKRQVLSNGMAKYTESCHSLIRGFFSSIMSNAAVPVIEPRPLPSPFISIYCSLINPSLDFFLPWRVSRGPRPHYRGPMIALRHTTFYRTPLDEWSARRRDHYLTPHYTHKWQTSLPRGDSNPQSQQENDCRPTPETALPLRVASLNVTGM